MTPEEWDREWEAAAARYAASHTRVVRHLVALCSSIEEATRQLDLVIEDLDDHGRQECE